MKKLILTALLLALCLALGGCITVNLTPASGEGDAQFVTPQPEDVPLDLEFDDLEIDDLEGEELDIPRTLAPATAEDQLPDAQADFVIKDDLFATQIDEISYFADEYLGKNFLMIGYVLHYDDGPGEQTQFAVVRDYQMPPHEHEDGEVVDHDDEEIYPVGFDCRYAGELPADGAWVRVVGTLTDYDYVDFDGEVYPALLLDLKSLEVIPETEGGSRVVTE